MATYEDMERACGIVNELYSRLWRLHETFEAQATALAEATPAVRTIVLEILPSGTGALKATVADITPRLRTRLVRARSGAYSPPEQV